MIPPHLLVHSVTVEPYEGRSSSGPVYGASFPLSCMRQGGVRLVRDRDGTERVSSVTLYAAPGQADAIPTGSRITWDGNATTVLVSVDHDDGELGAPQHTEVACE